MSRTGLEMIREDRPFVGRDEHPRSWNQTEPEDDAAGGVKERRRTFWAHFPGFLLCLRTVRYHVLVQVGTCKLFTARRTCREVMACAQSPPQCHLAINRGIPRPTFRTSKKLDRAVAYGRNAGVASGDGGRGRMSRPLAP